MNATEKIFYSTPDCFATLYKIKFYNIIPTLLLDSHASNTLNVLTATYDLS